MNAPLAPSLERLVVFCPSWIGDCVMATPVFRALRRAMPETWLLGVMRPGLDELLDGAAWFNEVLVDDLRGLSGPIRVARLIRRFEPDAGVLLPNSFRSALALRLAGPRVRIGYRRDGRAWLLTHAFPWPSRDREAPLATIELYLNLGREALGVDEIEPALALTVTDRDEEQAAEAMSDVPFVLLSPGARKAAKRWPPDRFAAVADHLIEHHGLRIAITGSPDEAALADSVRAASRRGGEIIDFIGQGVGLGALKALVRRAALLITNDSGTRHIAAALSTPALALFGPTDPRWTAIPAPREHQLLAEPFLPEELIADNHPRACRIERIAAGDVIAAAERLLSAS